MIAIFGPRFGQIYRQGNNGGQSPGEQNSFQSQNQNTSTSSTNTSAPSPAIQDPLMKQVNALQGYYDTNPTAPGYYPGSTIAPASAATQAAQGALFARGANGSPLTTAGNNFAASVLNPSYLDVGSDPYFQSSLAAGFAPQNENFNNVVAPAERAQFEGSGRNLGGDDMGTYALLRKGLDQTQSNASAQAVEQAFRQRMQNQFAALNYVPVAQNMDYQNIGAMQQAGAVTDQANQAAIDAAVRRYNYNATAQPNYFSDAALRYLAAYPGGTTTGSGTGTSTSTGSGYSRFMPPSNPTASGIGAGLAGAGTFAQFIPFLQGGLM